MKFREEEGALKKFVLLYFSSTFILLSIIFILIFNMQKRMLEDLTLAKMKNFSFDISSNIITAHMQNRELDFKQFLNREYQFSLLDSRGDIIFGDHFKRDKIYIEDKTPLGHLGVWSIIVWSSGFDKEIDSILYRVIFGFLISYTIISFVGYYLTKMFLQPIREARERLDNFIKDTTHELNTPITAIMMCANEQMLKNPKNLKRLYISAKRVSELYKDLTYLFLEERREAREVEISSIILEELHYFEILASTKKIDIEVDLEETKIYIDIYDFKRLFSNIISNAIKYNRQNGSISITLKDGVLKVADSGIGIDRDKLKKIFKRYYRATKNSGGFGIGLNIVEKIASRNGIKVNVNSSLSGTVFILDFNSNIRLFR